MKVYFLKDLQGVAKKGDIKEVKDGFARNYLIPKKIAIPFTDGLKKHLEDIERIKNEKIEKQKKIAKEEMERINGKVVEFQEKANEEGKLFGSIKEEDILKKLKEKWGIKTDFKVIAEPIKEIGERKVKIEFYGIGGEIIVNVKRKN